MSTTLDVYAQNDPPLLYGSKPLAQPDTPEQLHKKLEIAKDAISNLMGSKMSSIPFNSVGIDVINSTLDIGIDSTKAVLSEEEYEKKIRDIVGDIPIKITFGQISSLAPVLETPLAKNPVSSLLSPLKQFKSGVTANDIICRDDLQLLVETHEGLPICVKQNSEPSLLRQDWSYPSNCKYEQNAFTGGVAGLIVIEKNASNPSSDKSYSPKNSTVVIGWNNTVSWLNLDNTPSSVTSNWNIFDSGTILPGKDWQHTFDCAGNYGYHSDPHPWMKGWIKVLPPSR
ncbi:MAG: cupredoxin domain-containing protein [Nitrosotalea sp.]